MSRSRIITLTTDFGTVDGYVGTMKGVMLGIAPKARLVDITHDIAPQDTRQAAYVLYTAYRFFSSQAIHLVVVDPGVGSARRPVAVRLSHGILVGPDNGVFTYLMTEESVKTVIELANPRYHLPLVSQTFHARDIFAPAAAHLATGVAIEELGPVVSDPVTLPLPRLEISSRSISGEVLYTDRFGNVITSIGRLLWGEDDLSLMPAFGQESEEQARFQADQALVIVNDREIRGLRHTYADVEPGHVLALVGSDGHVEIAVRKGSGAQRLGVKRGDTVELRW